MPISVPADPTNPVPALPVATNPEEHRNPAEPQGPNAIPMPSGQPDFPVAPSGRWGLVKKKTKKLVPAMREGEPPIPQPASEGPQARKSPPRHSPAGTPSNNEPPTAATASSTANPFHRAMPQALGVVTFAADMTGIEFYHLSKTPILKKQDVEEVTMRDEIFASLSGPVSSKDQIRCSIVQGQDKGVTIEGSIERVLNQEAQSWIIARLADFLNGPNVFARTLAPFLTMCGEVESTHAAQSKILVREARINDVPIRSNAPVFHRATEGQAAKGGAMLAQAPTPGPSARKAVATPTWNPELTTARVDPLASVRRHEERMSLYKSKYDLVVPTPHDGRFERTFPATTPAPLVQQRPQEQPYLSHVQVSEASLRNQRYVTPSRESFYGAPAVTTYQAPPGIVYYDPLLARGRVESNGYPSQMTTPRQSATPSRGLEDASFGGPGTPRSGVYRTRQYVVEDTVRHPRIMRQL